MFRNLTSFLLRAPKNSQKRRPRKTRTVPFENLEDRLMLTVKFLGDEMLVNDSITRAQITEQRAPAVEVADNGNTIVAFSGRDLEQPGTRRR